MKNTLLFASLVCFSIACNKQNNDTPAITSAEFSVSSNQFYEIDSLSVRAADTTGGNSYIYDFGDGIIATGGYGIKHRYTKGGNFTVTLSIHGKTSTQRIRVFPGVLSYQIKNSSSRSMDVFTYVDNPWNGSAYRKFFSSNTLGDTLYATTLETYGTWPGALLHPLQASVFINNQEYYVKHQSNNLVSERQHHILEIKDSTQVSPRTGTGPTFPVFYLKDL